ncbi:MAG: phosphonate C-P lyase system protein PhnG [Desulforhopalus sp.]|nr:phosphonate C-P lyase system protein PhnG [Desulforhopalus sp.]
MINTDLTAVIDTMEEEKVEQLLQLFADVDLTISTPPHTGLMMLAVHDSFATAFYPGEILVTEARVIFRGYEGFGMVLGEAPRRALARAAADAVCHAPESTLIQNSVRTFLAKEAGLQKTRQLENAALVAATKVQFDLMPGA